MDHKGIQIASEVILSHKEAVQPAKGFNALTGNLFLPRFIQLKILGNNILGRPAFKFSPQNR